MFEELINLYTDAVKDAQSMWLSDYCCSSEEAEERKKEDEEKIKEFINICKRLEDFNVSN